MVYIKNLDIFKLALLLFLLTSCWSEVDVSLFGRDLSVDSVLVSGQKDLTLGDLDLTSPDPAQDIYITLPYVGDSNSNSVVTFYFCSIKQQAACEPVGSESIVLSKNGSNIEGVIDISSSSLSPGDFLKYKMVSSDIDGLSGGDDYGFILIPYDGSQPRAIRQLGKFTFGSDKSGARGSESVNVVVRASDGSIYIAGSTRGSLGEVSAGGNDVFIAKLGPGGVLDSSFGGNGIWQHGMISSSTADQSDEILDMKLDGSGNLYAVGQTYGALGGVNGGGSDGFILKMNAQSSLLDTSFGNGDGVNNDGIIQINSTYTTGSSGDDHLVNMLLDGAGNMFVLGRTQSSFGGPNGGGAGTDTFIAKLNVNSGVLDSSFGDGDGIDNDGIVQINNSNSNSASGNDIPRGMAIDNASGNVFCIIETGGSLGGTHGGGAYDFAVVKLSAVSGSLDTDFGDGDGIDNDGIVQINANNSNSATGWDAPRGIVLDGSGNVFVTGGSGSALGGGNAGSNDIVVIKISATSGVLDPSFGDGDGIDNDGILQINASNSNSAIGDDVAFGMELDLSGDLYISGSTTSSLSGTNAGSYDGFIIKIDASSGILDGIFGDGDGADNDGIVQINAVNSADASLRDVINSMTIDGSGNLYVSGDTTSSLGGVSAGSGDGFVIKLNSSSGVLNSSFGDGDGTDNDGIVQINAVNSADASSSDVINAMTIDGSGNLYVAGDTSSSLGGINAGSSDGFIIKMDASSGTLDSSFGDGDGADNDGIVQINAMNSADASSTELISAVTVDGSGNLYVSGSSVGSLGGVNAGSYDGFVIKMDASSGVLDSSFGDGDGADNDGIVQINAVNSADASSSDVINAMTIDGSGNLYVAGDTSSSLGGINAGSSDGFIIKMDASSGTLDSSFGDGDGADNDGIVQINAMNSADASSTELISAVTVDGSGNLYVSGSSVSSLGGANAGSYDGLIIKMDASSGVLDGVFGDGDGADNDGIVQINAVNSANASLTDLINAMTVDGSGNLYVSGSSFSSLGGGSAGNYDGVIIKMDASSGTLDSSFGDGDGADDDGIVQINAVNSADASASDEVKAMTIDGSGNLYISGITSGSLGGANAGSYDGFIIKMDASSGVLDASFGDGDGADNDGIVQINAVNTENASSADVIDVMLMDASGNLYVSGSTQSSLDGANAGSNDGFSAVILSGNDGL